MNTSTTRAGFIDRLLTERETAAMIGTTPGTLRTWRSTGREGQPPFVKIGRSCRYRLSDVQGYIANLSDGSEVAA